MFEVGNYVYIFMQSLEKRKYFFAYYSLQLFIFAFKKVDIGLRTIRYPSCLPLRVSQSSSKYHLHACYFEQQVQL